MLEIMLSLISLLCVAILWRRVERLEHRLNALDKTYNDLANLFDERIDK